MEEGEGGHSALSPPAEDLNSARQHPETFRLSACGLGGVVMNEIRLGTTWKPWLKPLVFTGKSNQKPGTIHSIPLKWILSPGALQGTKISGKSSNPPPPTRARGRKTHRRRSVIE